MDAQNNKPSLLTQMYSLAKATINHVKAGMPKASDEELNRRLSICESCPLLDKDQFRCNACGCYLTYKAGWQDQHCQEGKW